MVREEKKFINTFINYFCAVSTKLRLYEVLPFIQPICFNRNPRKRIKKYEQKPEVEFYIKGLSLEKLEKLHFKAMERRKMLDDKAKVNVSSIALALALLAASIAFVNGPKTSSYISLNYYSTSNISIFIVSCLYLFLAGISALLSLKLTVVYDFYIKDEIELIGTSDNVRIYKLIKYIKLNYDLTTIKENYVNCSYLCLRNAIICLFLLILSLVFGFYQSSDGRKNVDDSLVLEVISGDTFKALKNGKEDWVKLFITESPNSYTFCEKITPYVTEARIYTQRMIEGKKVRIVPVNNDFKQGPYTLAFVYLPDGRMLNKLLLEKGLARINYTQHIPNSIVDEFKRIQDQSVEGGLGIWALKNNQ